MKYMIKIKEYVMAESLEQAYELNQKKRNCIIGGMLWLKMGSRMVPTAHRSVQSGTEYHRGKMRKNFPLVV